MRNRNVKAPIPKDLYGKMEKIAKEKGVNTEELLRNFIKTGILIESLDKKGKIIIKDEAGNIKHEILP